jgi:hypothetical protein
MSRAVIIVAGFFIALPLTEVAQSTMKSAEALTRTSPPRVHSLLRTATSTTEFRKIAESYQQEQARYSAEAAAEKIELDRRARINAGLEQKYPRPVDSAKYLYQFYLYEAEDSARQARHYDQLASGAQSKF